MVPSSLLLMVLRPSRAMTLAVTTAASRRFRRFAVSNYSEAVRKQRSKSSFLMILVKHCREDGMRGASPELQAELQGMISIDRYVSI